MLKVQNFKTRARRSTETAVEGAFAATWNLMGLYSRHMSDAVPGLPDRYLAGGIWVEFKSLYRVRGEFTYGEGLSPEQLVVGRELRLAGDRVYYCAQLDGWSRGKCYVFLPFGDVIDHHGERLPDCEIWGGNASAREDITNTWLR